MSKSRRDKYRRSYDPSARKSHAQQQQQNVSSGSGAQRIKLEPGLNYIRIFPGAPSETGFYYSKKVHWMTLPSNKDDGETYKGNVLNAVVHGGLAKDVVEEYIAYMRKRAKEIGVEDEAMEKHILKPLSNYKTSPSGSATYPFYAIKVSDARKATRVEYGELEAKGSVIQGIEGIYNDIEEEASDVITVDPVTDVDLGVVIKIKYNDKAKKTSDYYSVTATSKVFPLTDEDLDWLEAQKTLTEKYRNVYTIQEFNKALEGIELFEEEFELDLSQEDEWLAIAEECKNLVLDAVSSEEETEEEEPKKKRASKKKVAKKVEEEAEEEEAEEEETETEEEETEETEETETEEEETEEEETEEEEEEEEEETEEEEEETEDDPHGLNDMDRPELKSFIAKNKLHLPKGDPDSIILRKSDTEDDIREKIVVALAIREEKGDNSPSLDDIKKKLKG